MFTSQTIRQHHKHHHYLLDDLKSVTEETHFKIALSHPDEMIAFEKYCKQSKGNYFYDKEISCQKGKLPKLELFKDEICLCHIMTYYLLHAANYKYQFSLHPY